MRKKLINLYRLILSDRNTRNLLFFLVLNLLFAFIELFYGLMTNRFVSQTSKLFNLIGRLLILTAISVLALFRIPSTCSSIAQLYY